MNIISCKYFLIALLWLIPFYASSEMIYKEKTIEITNQFIKLDLQGNVKVFRSESKVNPMIFLTDTDNPKVEAVKNNEMSFGFSQDFFWILITIKNAAQTSKELYLELKNPHIDTTFFYKIDSTKTVALLLGKGGDRMLFNERPLANRRFIFPIHINGLSTSKYVLLVDKRNASVSYPLTLWDSEEFEKHEKTNNLFYMLYFGGILFIFLFSLVIGLIMKNWRLLTYSFYSGLMGFYLFIGIGFAFQYLYPWSDSLNNYIRTQVAILLLISFIIFTFSYLQVKKSHLLSYRILMVLTSLLLFLFLMSVVFQDFSFKHIVVLLKIFYSLIFIFFPVTVIAVIKSYKYYKYQAVTYILAITSLFTGATVFNLIEFGIIEESYVPINPILIGSIIELFIFSTSFIIEIKKINDKKNSLLKASAEQQRNLLKAYIEGTEAEGNRISQELHDNIGSRLALIKNQLKNTNSNPEILEKNISEIFSEVRTISNELSPNSLHILGLVQCTKQLLNNLEFTGKIKVNFYAADSIDLTGSKSLQIYRVIQESIQNIMKHSKASQVDFQILKENKKVIITIDDNGVGFDTKKKSYKHGNGLNNMKMRVESVNGKIEISSQPEKGTHIMIWI